MPDQQAPVSDGEGFAHEIVDGLTSIILPVYLANYTLFHYTGNCIGSIREHTHKDDYELVIVDNGSPLQPPALDSYYAHRVIKNAENLGVTKAWNQGIRTSVGEYIVLLNNDVQVFDWWLDDLKSVLNGGYDLVMAHPMYSLTEPFARAVESKVIRDKVLLASEGNLQKVLSGFKDFSCVMFKRSLIDELGLFDERFFNYASDSDFFRRLDEAGKKWACVETVATSHISDATGFSIPETPEIMNKDKEEFRKKWEAREMVIAPEDIKGNYEATVDLKKIYLEDEDPRLIRTPATGNSIYLIIDGEYHHINDPETLHALGFEFGDEQTIEGFGTLTRGEAIGMTNYQKYV